MHIITSRPHSLFLNQSTRNGWRSLCLTPFACIVFLTLGTMNGVHAKISVVTSTTDLASIARAVGGDVVNVQSLAQHTQDTHFVDARPSFLVPLSRADLVVYHGLELEVGWLPPLINNARNEKIQLGTPGNLNASTAVSKLMNVPIGAIDRSMGDIHPGGNPHFTIDPRAAIEIAKAIQDRLIAIDAGNTATYVDNYRQFANDVKQFSDAQIARFSMLPKSKRRLTSYHRSLTYFADWLGLDVLLTIEIKPGIPPSPKHTAKVVREMRDKKISLIIQENYYPRRTTSTIARLTKAEVVIIEQVDMSKKETYIQNMTQITDEVFRVLQK